MTTICLFRNDFLKRYLSLFESKHKAFASLQASTNTGKLTQRCRVGITRRVRLVFFLFCGYTHKRRSWLAIPQYTLEKQQMKYCTCARRRMIYECGCTWELQFFKVAIVEGVHGLLWY